MLRVRRFLVPAVAVLAAGISSGCGGETKTVTETAAAPPPTGSAEAPPETPTGATGASAEQGATGEERTPTEPLPTVTGGAVVIQGTYDMVVADESDARGYSDDDELTWTAVTRCDADCVVVLNRETDSGAFTRIELPNLSKTRYGRDGTGSIDCLGQVKTKNRTSLSALKVRDQDGIELASEIQGFVRSRFTCTNGYAPPNDLLRVQGRLREESAP